MSPQLPPRFYYLGILRWWNLYHFFHLARRLSSLHHLLPKSELVGSIWPRPIVCFHKCFRTNDQVRSSFSTEIVLLADVFASLNQKLQEFQHAYELVRTVFQPFSPCVFPLLDRIWYAPSSRIIFAHAVCQASRPRHHICHFSCFWSIFFFFQILYCCFRCTSLLITIVWHRHTSHRPFCNLNNHSSMLGQSAFFPFLNAFFNFFFQRGCMCLLFTLVRFYT